MATPAFAQLQRSIVNPGFEDNDPGGPGPPTFAILPNTSVSGWDTTTGVVELWDSGFQGVPAAAGLVFAEINANSPGALYQNVCMVSGDVIKWKFSHRARGTGTETASFQIASQAGALIQNLQTSAVVRTSGWVVRSNTAGVAYTGPSGIQRIQFSTTDPGSSGNFLDDIQIQLATYLEFDPANTSSREGVTSPTLPALRLTGSVATPFNVTVNVTGGTATLGSDFVTPNGASSFTVTVPAGNYQYTSIPLGITIISDGVSEASETINLSITPSPKDFSLSSTTICGGTAAANAVHTISDPLTIVAASDTATNQNGVTGNTSALNVLTGDTIGGVAATTSSAVLSLPSGSIVPSQLTFTPATGVIALLPGTPAGTYSFVYQICEKLNPTNCATNVATVTVAPSFDLQTTKSNGKTSVFSGSTTTYTLTVTNNGPDSASGAVVSDTPNAGLTCPAGDPVTIVGAGSPSGTFTIGNLTGPGITLGTIANGQSVTVTYSCQVN